MNTTHNLRDALEDQERYAPDEAGILAELDHRRRSRRTPVWSAGLLTAAAVAAIVIGVSAVAGPQAVTPVTPAVSIVPATSLATQTRPTSDLQKVQDQQQSRAQLAAEAQAKQAAQSVEDAANHARLQVLAAAKACSRETSSTALMVDGHLDATRIAAVTRTCATAYGARDGYIAQWVQTTVGALSTLTTGQFQRDTTPIVAVQIQGAFAAGGQSGETETMILMLSPDGALPQGTLTNSTTVNLATLGPVHRI